MSPKTLIIMASVLGAILLGTLLFFFLPKPEKVVAKAPDFTSMMGEAPPSLSSDTEWLTQDVGTLESLRGKVVWLEFNYTASRSYRDRVKMLRSWDSSFKSEGLRIINVIHQPKDEEKGGDRRNLKNEIRDGFITYGVLMDTAGKSSEAFGVTRFPASYLIGRDGNVVWEGANNFIIAETKLKGELKK